jgi:lupus La protein
MADTQPAAEAPATNLAEVTQSNESAQAVAEPDTAESAKPSDKEGTNGTAEPGKEAEASTRENNDRSNGRPFDNKRGGRGGRGGGRFGGNKQFRKCVDPFGLHMNLDSHSHRRNDEFENLPESDDPNEIRQQVS